MILVLSNLQAFMNPIPFQVFSLWDQRGSHPQTKLIMLDWHPSGSVCCIFFSIKKPKQPTNQTNLHFFPIDPCFLTPRYLSNQIFPVCVLAYSKLISFLRTLGKLDLIFCRYASMLEGFLRDWSMLPWWEIRGIHWCPVRILIKQKLNP